MFLYCSNDLCIPLANDQATAQLFWFVIWSLYLVVRNKNMAHSGQTINPLQSLTQKKSNFAWGKAKLSQPARQLSFAFSEAKLLFFCVKDCRRVKSSQDLFSSKNKFSEISDFEKLNQNQIILMIWGREGWNPPDAEFCVFSSHPFLKLQTSLGQVERKRHKHSYLATGETSN